MKYIVAVSGGIDSVVLLDMLNTSTDHALIVAHFDHGIRKDSREDLLLVKELASQYNLPFECHEAKLGQDVSEAEARYARYSWLASIQQMYRADAIATAHHQDDVIETMIINLIRGTGWRGLVSLANHEKLMRPLLSWSKQAIVSYAIEHDLTWHEDSTNDDVRYLRNYIRYRYVQRLSQSERAKWLELNASQAELRESIDRELRSMPVHTPYNRYDLIMGGREIVGELLTFAYGRMEKSTIDQLWHFICTGKPGKQFEQGGLQYQLTTRELIVSPLYT